MWKNCDGREGGLPESMWKNYTDPDINKGRPYDVYYEPSDDEASDSDDY